MQDNSLLSLFRCSGGINVNSQENSTGRPLADASWLENHHRAKLPERTAFAKQLAELKPKSIVDLGCATGLWLELLDSILPADCEFVGIDSDEEALSIAADRSQSWNRRVKFLHLDIEEDVEKIPPGDITLAFNIFPYIENLELFIEALREKSPNGVLAVRQYDGASIRFGPMETAMRQKIELDLRIATENSQKFHHYDMDRTFTALRKSNYKRFQYNFELFERVSPFDSDFIPYYNGTLDWTCQHISNASAVNLKKWMNTDSLMADRYFFEVDLVALLS